MDSDDRLLLFRLPWSSADPDGRHLWITPGGGVNEAEPLHEAAARELREETGLVVAAEDLLPQVCYIEGYAEVESSKGVFREDFFFHRTASFEVDDSGQEEWERKFMLGHRWWALDELKATLEFIVPFGLAGILDDLLAGSVPAAPIQLPWHH